MKNVILRKKELKTGETEASNKLMYFEMVELSDKSDDLKLDKTDFNNIEKIYNISKEDKKNGTPYWNNTATVRLGGGAYKIITNITTTVDITQINDTLTKDNYNNLKISKKSKIKFYEGKKHPMIKYFIILINLLIINETPYDDFIGITIILIYKYVSFIVDQGAAIVTNLEHLKFFFLSNTDNVEKYNSNPKTLENQKYVCESTTECKNLLDNPRSYSVETNIGKGISLYESINLGQMKEFKLLPILQDLAKQESKLDNLQLLKYNNPKTNSEEYTLDLFHSKKEQTGGNTASKNALFVMFTNVKIFRDDSNKADGTDKLTTEEQDESKKTKLVSNLNLLCPAEFDTLEFAQSISSTTQNVSKPAKGGSLNRHNYKTNKFNMKALTQKQRAIKTHKSTTLKKRKRNPNQRAKTLFARRSKKYYD
jgi:hypothetical protein